MFPTLMSSDALPPFGTPFHPVPPGLGDAAPHPVPPPIPQAPTQEQPAAAQPEQAQAAPAYPAPAYPVPPPIPRMPTPAAPVRAKELPRALPVAEAIVEEDATPPEPRLVIPHTKPKPKIDPNVEPATDPFRGGRKLVVSTLASSVVHFALVLLLALLTFDSTREPPRIQLTASVDTYAAPSFTPLKKTPPKIESKPVSQERNTSPKSLADVLVTDPTAGKQGDEVGTERTEQVAVLKGNNGIGDLLTPLSGVGGGEIVGMLDGRDGDLKKKLLEDGATEDTEEAVRRGLRWLAAHQLEDGSWRFNHQQGGVCKYCPNPGNHGSTTGATGLALLPFLGANQTHRKGEYQEQVRKGLDFLKRKMISTPLGGDLQDGVNLYSQAIATLALCEAYAMTRDEELHKPCVAAITFIINSQDKKGGGWRYFPGQVGDTTVTGWMMMALKSGQLTYMPIPPETWTLAKKFLDGVQDEAGAAYGYQSPAKDEPTMTSIGILCRMYGGWPRSQPALQRAIRGLSRRGRSDHDQYYNYYATQSLRHFGGSEWIAWNEEMKAFLLQSQSRQGHQSGSWYFPDKHGDQGGRLYNTALSILILEVYYRYLPIYGTRVTAEDFK